MKVIKVGSDEVNSCFLSDGTRYYELSVHRVRAENHLLTNNTFYQYSEQLTRAIISSTQHSV